MLDVSNSAITVIRVSALVRRGYVSLSCHSQVGGRE
jgi:hypothetical protein